MRNFKMYQVTPAYRNTEIELKNISRIMSKHFLDMLKQKHSNRILKVENHTLDINISH